MIALLVYYFVFLRTEGDPAKKHKEVSDAKTVVSDSKSDLEILFGFIQKAYEGLEHNDVNHAYENYSLAFSHYASANLSFKHKLRINFEMNTLHEKIIEATKPPIKSKHLYT